MPHAHSQQPSSRRKVCPCSAARGSTGLAAGSGNQLSGLSEPWGRTGLPEKREGSTALPAGRGASPETAIDSALWRGELVTAWAHTCPQNGFSELPWLAKSSLPGSYTYTLAGLGILSGTMRFLLLYGRHLFC